MSVLGNLFSGKVLCGKVLSGRLMSGRLVSEKLVSETYLEIMSNICWEPELKIKSEVKKSFRTVASHAKRVPPSLCKTY